MDALIGHTGLVGGTLLRQRDFGARFRSTDIGQIEGKRFRHVVCAGVQAVKWWANANAAEDLAGIERLMRHLERMEAERFTLISTVDVYGSPAGVDEQDAVPVRGLHPYGLHRAMLEDWARERFARCHVVRLPALFGPGLKKNALFDLMHGHQLDAIDPASRFQWYPLARLSDDLGRIEAAGVPLVNLVTAPVEMRAIQSLFFPGRRLGREGRPVSYDVRTRHDALFGGADGYALDAAEAMAEMGRFLAGCGA